ncbi:Ribosomal protein Rsm22-like, partial [Dillenia turbinata]
RLGPNPNQRESKTGERELDPFSVEALKPSSAKTLKLSLLRLGKWRLRYRKRHKSSSLRKLSDQLLNNPKNATSSLLVFAEPSKDTSKEKQYMRRKVLRLSESFSTIKDANLQICATTSKELVEDPLKSVIPAQRWKIKSAYGDIGLKYKEGETVAYVASRMPATLLVRRRLPGFSPAKVLDFGTGTGSVLWVVREVWPKSLQRINLVEPSQSMQRAGQHLVRGLKDLPLIHSYNSIPAFTQNVKKSERKHDLVIASYVLGEIPSLKDQITIVRQLWDLTRDVLVLVEPGTPQGSSIITTMRSHILWMEKRKCRKNKDVSTESSKDIVPYRGGAFVVAPCPHDGRCPLENTEKYCHFVQQLERTTSQRAYKRSKGEPLRVFEDEKFCFVALRRGQRPFTHLGLTMRQVQHAKRRPEDFEIDFEDQFESEPEGVIPCKRDCASYNSDATETDADDENDQEEDEDEEATTTAGLGSSWGRIIYMPVRRGRRAEVYVCRDGSEGSFERIVVTE